MPSRSGGFSCGCCCCGAGIGIVVVVAPYDAYDTVCVCAQCQAYVVSSPVSHAAALRAESHESCTSGSGWCCCHSGERWHGGWRSGRCSGRWCSSRSRRWTCAATVRVSTRHARLIRSTRPCVRGMRGRTRSFGAMNPTQLCCCCWPVPITRQYWALGIGKTANTALRWCMYVKQPPRARSVSGRCGGTLQATKQIEKRRLARSEWYTYAHGTE